MYLNIIIIISKPGYKIICILFKYPKCNILILAFDFGIKCDFGPRHEPNPPPDVFMRLSRVR